MPVDGSGAVGEGEICLDLSRRPVPLMAGYHGDDERTAEAMAGGYYHTGDVGSVDADGYITYVGRADDVFKASDYRISPVRAGIGAAGTRIGGRGSSGAVAGRAAAGRSEGLRGAGGRVRADSRTAGEIFAHSMTHLAPYKRIRRLEFAELPKTISGKIRRVELRGREDEIHATSAVAPPTTEFRLEDFPRTAHLTATRPDGACTILRVRPGMPRALRTKAISQATWRMRSCNDHRPVAGVVPVVRVGRPVRGQRVEVGVDLPDRTARVVFSGEDQHRRA